MFDLDAALDHWRKEMAQGGVTAAEILDELESHLREDVERAVQSGATAEAAFAAAAQQMGHPEVLRKEFMKAGETFFERFKQFIFTLAGIPNYQLATNMNTNSNIEPGWATYLKAAAFAFPAFFLWTISVLLLFPKLTQICQTAGTSVFDFGDAPGGFGILAKIGQLMMGLTHNGLLIGCAVIVTLGLLEWRSAQWPRYRRAAVGIGAFMLNAIVLISITMMVISAIIAAPALMHSK